MSSNGFKSLERRIAINEKGDRFRVQWIDKKGKGQAKIVKTIEQARELRDSTDTKRVKESLKEVSVVKKRVEPAIMELKFNDSSLSEDKKIKLAEKLLEVMGKLFA